MTETTRVVRLSRDNVRALREHPEVLGVVEVTATTATFEGSPSHAAVVLRSGMETLAREYGRRGHPVHSLQAVARRVERQVEPLPTN